MRLVDSHAHLNHPDYERDRDAVLNRARAAGVETVLVVGYDLPSSHDAVGLAQAIPMVYAAVGIHPHDAETLDEAALAELRHLLAQPKVVGVGETGLDYYRDLSPRQRQQAALRTQLQLARETNRPVILHNRDADDDLLRLLREVGLPAAGGVLHCFSGDARLAAEALSLGLMISIAGQITFKNAEPLRRVVATLPLDRLMVETDSPYLSPVPYRGKRNEPARVAEVARCIAALKGTAPEEIAAVTTANARRLFGIVGG